METHRILIIGGGAAGFFGAIAAAEADPSAQVTLLERSKQPLAKVRISGGGRCNVTHHCFDPAELIKHYPRGGRELRGPFSRFQPQDMIDWLASKGVTVKAEADGRMFPNTDDSQTIIDALENAAKEAGVRVWNGVNIAGVTKDEGRYSITLKNGTVLEGDRLLLATGSSPAGHRWAKQLGHTIEPLAPSLFTFNIPKSGLSQLSGVVAPDATIAIDGTKLRQRGPLLITHWGFSGPAALKLSAWAARELAGSKYTAELRIAWISDLTVTDAQQRLNEAKKAHPKRLIIGENPFTIPLKLWKALVARAGITDDQRWAHISREQQDRLANAIADDRYQVKGKTTNKEEFVTCGGVKLSEVDFRTMESKKSPGLHLAGEILDIDGVTGGFNFQAAWTTSWLAGQAMASET